MKVKDIVLAVFGVALVSAIIYAVWQGEKEPPEEVDLKLRLKAGESHEMRFTCLENIIPKVENRQLQSRVETEATVGIEVPSVDANGTMNIELIYKAIKLDVNNPGRHIQFDSANPKQEAEPNDPNVFLQNAVADVYLATIGSRLKITVSPTGKTSDISGFDGIRAKIEGKIKERLIADINSSDDKAVRELQKNMAESIAKMLARGYNSILSSLVIDNTREMIDYIIVKFPDGPSLVGSKWRGSARLSLGFMADANTTYKFERRENGCAYIGAVCDLDMGKELRITEMSNAGKISRRMSGSRKSSNMVDEATGLLRKSEAVMLFSGIARIEPDRLQQIMESAKPFQPREPPPPSIINIPITVEGSETVELIK